MIVYRIASLLLGAFQAFLASRAFTEGRIGYGFIFTCFTIIFIRIFFWSFDE